EHHHFPGVPYANLPALFRLLRRRGFYDATPEALGRGYLAVLWGLIFPARAASATTARRPLERSEQVVTPGACPCTTQPAPSFRGRPLPCGAAPVPDAAPVGAAEQP